MLQLVLFHFANGRGSCLSDVASLLYAVSSCLCWSSAAAPPTSYFSLCQVRSQGLMEAFRGVIGRSIRHSALGTLTALIRSLGLLTSQGWMLQQSTDQMTVPCFAGACKGGGRRQKKGICLVSQRPFFYTCLALWCRSRFLASAVMCIALHLCCKMPEGSATPCGLIWFQRVNWWRGSRCLFWFLPLAPLTGAFSVLT